MSVAEVLVASSRLSVRDAALAFARAGIPVFPCVPEGKHPLTPAGFHDASSDLEQVRAWWTRWPSANIGMPTGSASGIDVVDIDVTKADAGFAAFERATAAGLVDGELARVRTPSGGMHVYFVAIADRPQRCWQAASAHIDFRGDGGYVIVPPSILATDTGASYRLYSLSSAGSKPVDAVALRGFIDPRPPQAGTRATTARPPEPSRLAQWVSNLQEGERNSGLFWAACRLVEAGFAPADVEAALAPSAQTAGLDEREILTTISSASRRGAAGAQAFDRAASGGRRGDAPCLS
ncbi:bifunctional DNA primase/polymerase [Cryobacterium sp. Y29]|uniref:bifunctional DNA primase/polymerase n=1 Tax=Cryobacterium sp. Y29 TaxID=2048285 RepID=UPI000CE53BEB|nr:bifunctional DNA primase/polymerase [Cryobacterium sp. Y29]